MIVMKLINGSGDENTQNQSVLPSEPIATQDNNNDTSFESMPITDNTSAEDQFEALRKQFQDEQNTTQNTTASSSNNNDSTNLLCLIKKFQQNQQQLLRKIPLRKQVLPNKK